MAIAFDAISESGALFTTDDNWTHTPSGTPRGVFVFIAQNSDTAADQINSVTYGGQALTRLEMAADTATEPGAAYLYFLGSGIPTGAQTVQVNETGGASKYAWAVTVTASSDVTVEDSGTQAENQANPSITLTTGASVVTYVLAGLWSGVGTIGTATAGSGFTMLDQFDMGASTAHLEDIDTNDAGGNVTVGFTVSTDDVAMVAAAVKEAGGPANVTGASSMTLTFGFTTAGTRKTSGASTATFTFGFTTAGTRKALGSSSATLAFGFTSAASRIAKAASSATFTFGLTSAGKLDSRGASSSTIAFGLSSAGSRAAFGASTSAHAFGFTTAGTRTATGSSALPIVFTLFTSSGGVVQGASSLTLPFGFASQGATRIMGASSATFTFGLATAGQVARFGASTLPMVWSATSVAYKSTTAASALPIVFGFTSVGTGPSVVILPAGEPGYIADYRRGRITVPTDGRGRIPRSLSGRIS